MADWKNLGSKAKSLTLTGLDKAKAMGQSAKLGLDNVSEEENRKNVYAEIGKRYVMQNPVPEAGFEELYELLEQIETRIEANRAQIAKLKEE